MTRTENTTDQFDVLVVGAGVGGVAAALESARFGLKTGLVEKGVLAGGLATSGLVNVYLPLCDGCGRQVTFGIAEELLHLSIRYGPGDVPPEWRTPGEKHLSKRYRTVFSPASFALALDEALLQAGVVMYFDTLACIPVMKANRVYGVEVENKRGRCVLRASVVIDATGDAELAHRAGAECEESGNWLSVWALQASLESAKKAVQANSGAPLLNRLSLGRGGAAELAPPDGGYKGTTAEDVTRFLLDSRKLLLDHYKGAYAQGTDRRDLFPLTLPSMAQFRTTRRIIGRATITARDVGRYRPDSVGLIADWRKCGAVWEIPYGALLPEKVAGLLAVGRCISSEGDAWHVTRAIPCAALTGQIAGIAAALALRDGVAPDCVSAEAIQTELARKNIPFHLSP